MDFSKPKVRKFRIRHSDWSRDIIQSKSVAEPDRTAGFRPAEPVAGQRPSQPPPQPAGQDKGASRPPPVMMREVDPPVAQPAEATTSAPAEPNTSRRLYDRLPLDGCFRTKTSMGSDLTYELGDISLGGMRLNDSQPGVSIGDILSGTVEIVAGKISVSSAVTCQVVGVDEGLSTRLKFLDIAEEFIEFLRATIWRDTKDSDYKTDWLSREPMMTALDVKPGRRRRVLSQIMRYEVLAIVLLLGLAFIILIRTTATQSFWITQSYEVLSPLNARIYALQDDWPIEVGEELAVLEVITVSGEPTYLSVAAPVTAQTGTWRYNEGDRVRRDEILGFLGSVPLSNGHVQIIVAVDSPLYTLRRNDEVIFHSGTQRNLRGTVTYGVTPEQAARFSGMNDAAMLFDTYQVVELEASPQLAFGGDIRINHVATLYGRVSAFIRSLLP